MRLDSGALPVLQLPPQASKVVSLSYRGNLIATCSATQQPPDVNLWDCRMISRTPGTSTSSQPLNGGSTSDSQEGATRIGALKADGMRCALCVFMDGERIAVGSYDSHVRLWSSGGSRRCHDEGEFLGAIELSSPPLCLSTYGPGSPIAVGCVDHSIWIMRPRKQATHNRGFLDGHKPM